MNREIVGTSGTIYPLTGDVTSTAGQPTVAVTGIQTIPVINQVPKVGQILIADQSTGTLQYIPGDPIVSGPNSTNTLSTSNPIQIAGVDNNGIVRGLTSNPSGELNVIDSPLIELNKLIWIDIQNIENFLESLVQNKTPFIVGQTSGANLHVNIDNFPSVQQVQVADSPTQTYSATVLCSVAASAPTDVCMLNLNNVNGKTVRVKKFILTAIKTAGAIGAIFLLKRSTTDSFTSSTTVNGVPHDSNNALSNGTLITGTLSSTGTLVGTVRVVQTLITASGGTSTLTQPVEWEFDDNPAQPFILRGTECLVINLNGVTQTGISLYVTFEWEEI